jgi:hypothetical protein
MNPAIVGQPVIFTATVSSTTAAGLITGTVRFMQGQIELAVRPVGPGSAAVFETSFSAPTRPTIVAYYSGDSTYAPSTSNAVNQVNNYIPTQITLDPAQGSGFAGMPVTLTAHVTPQIVLSPQPPLNGTVMFRGGRMDPNTVPLVDGSAGFVMLNMPAGSNQITAVYTSASPYTGSTSAPITYTAVKANTTTAIVSSAPNPSKPGEPVVFKVTVTQEPGGAAPGGLIVLEEGNTTLGMGSAQGGIAVFTVQGLSLKNDKLTTYQIKAKYQGDANTNASTTLTTFTHVVEP